MCIKDYPISYIISPQAFSDVIIRDSELVCVELVARDRKSNFESVLFLGSIRYEALKKVYDARTNDRWQKLFKKHKRVEFMKMRGPSGKGSAEMAVTRVKGCGPETPEQTPTTEQFPYEDFDSFSERRMSDPAAQQSWSMFSKMRKSRSETDSVVKITEVEANEIRDELDTEKGFWGASFGQAWGWFKERRRANSLALHCYLTFITLPWHRIVAGKLI